MRQFDRIILNMFTTIALLTVAGMTISSAAQRTDTTRRLRHGGRKTEKVVNRSPKTAALRGVASPRRTLKPNSVFSITVTAAYDSAAANSSSAPLTAGGAVTLRSAIQYLNDGGASVDTIFIPAGTYILSDTGYDEDDAATGDLDVNSSVVLMGHGDDSTILVGDSDRVLEINPALNPGVSVTIANMTIRAGQTRYQSGEDGGAIEIHDADVELDTVAVVSNIADGNGGGINLSADGGTVIMNGGSLDSNATYNSSIDRSVEDAPNGPGNGGAANFDAGAGTFNGVTMDYNFAYGQGGAVHSTNDGINITANNCLVYKNTSSAAWAGAFSVDGGNLIVNGGVLRGNTAPFDGGAIDNAGTGKVTITNALIDSNSSSTGGAIGVEINFAATTTLSGCTVDNNFTADFPGSSDMGGGAIFVYSPLTIMNSSVDSNHTGTLGGGLYFDPGESDSLINVTLDGNSADGSGGAIYDDTYPVYFSSVVITNNTSVSNGGGIFDQYGDIYWGGGELSNNSCTSASGGGLYFVGASSINDTLYHVTVSNNSPNDIDTSAASGAHVVFKDNSLAVEATDFLATATADSVSLSWDTQSENGNAGFNILREDPGSGFFKIVGSFNSDENLRGLGTSSTGRAYAFTDPKVIPGSKYTYEIQSVSTSGSTKILTTLTVTASAPESYALYQNYPNPFNPSTTIRFDLKQQSTVALNIYNTLGQDVVNFDFGTMTAGEYNETVNMNRFASGVYFYRIIAVGTNGERFTSMKKFVLAK